MKWAPGEEEGHGSDICQMHCPAEFEIPWLTSGRTERSLTQMADGIALLKRASRMPRLLLASRISLLSYYQSFVVIY
jgi:hypothetical protein